MLVRHERPVGVLEPSSGTCKVLRFTYKATRAKAGVVHMPEATRVEPNVIESHPAAGYMLVC